MLMVTGSSVAILFKDQVVTFLRDEKPDLAYANMWDLPGGELEIGENPIECGIRETLEEVGVPILSSQVIWERDYPFLFREGVAHFMVAQLDPETIMSLQLGDEGQEARLMPIAEFLTRSDVVPAQQERLLDYIGFAAALHVA